MSDERKQKLMDLGLEALADLLLDIASKNQNADDRINQLVAPALANIQRFRRRIAAIKNNTQFIGYNQIFSFAIQLDEMLDDLKKSAPDPCIGLDLVAEFFETDSFVFENSDDDGIIGDVYTGHAKELFVSYASACPDMEKVASRLLRLSINDDYGTRDSLMRNIVESFEKPVITILQKKLMASIAIEQDHKIKQSFTTLLRTITDQLKHATLLEDALQGKQVDLSPSEILKVSRTLLERDDVEAAHSWIRRMGQNTSSHTHEIETILKEIYARQGDKESLIALHYENFKSFRRLASFQDLLKVAGEDKRFELLAQELDLIRENQEFDDNDAKFLSDVGMIDELEAYVFARVEKLDGSSYYLLPPLAETLIKHGRYLAATLIYRALLNSMMERAYAKSYHHGVDYLHAMDKVSPLIKDWKTYPTHNAFKVRLLQANRRKTSFWNQYLTR